LPSAELTAKAGRWTLSENGKLPARTRRGSAERNQRDTWPRLLDTYAQLPEDHACTLIQSSNLHTIDHLPG